jgi:hypothetical protein
VGSKSTIYILAVVLLLGGGIVWYFNHPAPLASAPPLTSDAKAYVRSLQLSDVTMKATESYVKQMVTEIEGKVTNAGTRTVKQVDVYCIFYNVYGEVVLRRRVPIVMNLVKPGDSRSFRMPFDDIPESWNNQMPQLVIAGIQFG